MKEITVGTAEGQPVAHRGRGEQGREPPSGHNPRAEGDDALLGSRDQGIIPFDVRMDEPYPLSGFIMKRLRPRQRYLDCFIREPAAVEYLGDMDRGVRFLAASPPVFFHSISGIPSR